MSFHYTLLGAAVGAFVGTICGLAGVAFWPTVVLAFLAAFIVTMVVPR